MGLFSKKKEENKKSCCCGGTCNKKAVNEAEKSKISGASIKILGSGCSKCNQLEKNTVEALQALGMDTSIDHITDFGEMAAYGVMSTPALVVDGKVLSYGKVLKPEEIEKIIQNARG